MEWVQCLHFGLWADFLGEKFHNDGGPGQGVTWYHPSANRGPLQPGRHERLLRN